MNSKNNIDISKLITIEDLETLRNFYTTCKPVLDENINNARIMFSPAVQFKQKVDSGFTEGAPMHEAKITRAIMDEGKEELKSVPVPEAYEKVTEFLDNFSKIQELNKKIEKLFNKINVALEI